MMRAIVMGLILVVVCLGMVGCNKESEVEAIVESGQTETKLNPFDAVVSDKVVSTVEGFSIRDPKTDEEKFAMQFVDALFWRNKAGGKKAVLEFVDIEGLAPRAPFQPVETDLYDIVIGSCLGFLNFSNSTNYKEVNYTTGMYTGLHITWDDKGSESARSVGIVENTDLGIVVAHSWDGTQLGFYSSGQRSGTQAEVYGAALIRVSVGKDSNGKLKVVPADYQPKKHGGLVEQEFKFRVPMNGVVTFRGKELEPSVKAKGTVYFDEYVLDGFYYRVPEEIVVDYGELVGEVRDSLVVTNLGSKQDEGMMFLANNNIYQAGTLMTNLPGLAVTTPRFQALADEIASELNLAVNGVVRALEANDIDFFGKMLFENGLSWQNWKNLEREFNAWVKDEQDSGSTNMKGIIRTADIAAIQILTSRTFTVTVMHTFTIEGSNGVKTYGQSFDWVLTKSSEDNVWYINQVPQNFFSRSTDTWKEIK